MFVSCALWQGVWNALCSCGPCDSPCMLQYGRRQRPQQPRLHAYYMMRSGDMGCMYVCLCFWRRFLCVVVLPERLSGETGALCAGRVAAVGVECFVPRGETGALAGGLLSGCAIWSNSTCRMSP